MKTFLSLTASALILCASFIGCEPQGLTYPPTYHHERAAYQRTIDSLITASVTAAQAARQAARPAPIQQAAASAATVQQPAQAAEQPSPKPAPTTGETVTIKGITYQVQTGSKGGRYIMKQREDGTGTYKSYLPKQ